MAKEFKENIEKNLSEGLVSHEDVEDIYDFLKCNKQGEVMPIEEIGKQSYL